MPNNIDDVTFAGAHLLAGYQPPWVEQHGPRVAAEPRLPVRRLRRDRRSSCLIGLGLLSVRRAGSCPSRHRTGGPRNDGRRGRRRSTAPRRKRSSPASSRRRSPGSAAASSRRYSRRRTRGATASSSAATRARRCSASSRSSSPSVSRATGGSCWRSTRSCSLRAAVSAIDHGLVPQARLAGHAAVQRRRRPARRSSSSGSDALVHDSAGFFDLTVHSRRARARPGSSCCAWGSPSRSRSCSSSRRAGPTS